jgi:Eukaryotic aspartyl protease
MKLRPSLVALATIHFVSCHASPNVLPLHRRSKEHVLKVTGADLYNLFDTEVIIGNQTFIVQVDTGSSDIWVLQDGWQCVNSTTDLEIPQADCTFGNATYTPSPTLEIIEDEYFGVVYGAGNALGELAYEDVTLGGITVQRQIIGLVNSTCDTGSGIDEGVMGFGYPALTMAHFGSEVPDNDTEGLLLNRTTYDSLFTRMWKQGLVEPWFSIALERPSSDDEIVGPGGYLGLGELPAVPYDNDSWAAKPVEITNGIPGAFTNYTQEITEWTLTVDGISWAPPDKDGKRSIATPSTCGFASNSTAFQAVVDSGQPLNLLPPAIINEVHALFDPPVRYDADSDIYVASCDSKPARLGIQLGHLAFWLKPEDLIMPVGDGSCMSTLYPTASSSLGVSFNFLGDAFLRNVVAIFDFGDIEMRFAARRDGGGVSRL